MKNLTKNRGRKKRDSTKRVYLLFLKRRGVRHMLMSVGEGQQREDRDRCFRVHNGEPRQESPGEAVLAPSQ